MANEKITELEELASGSVAEDDVLAIVDVSSTTVSITGETKKITQADLFDSGTSMPSLAEVGTITTGTWTGTTLGVGYGGTGLTTVTSGDILYADGTDSLAALGKGDDGKVLTLDSGIPAWGTVAGTGNVNNTGTPLDTQVAVWTDATTIKGDAGLTYNSSTDALTTTTFIGALTGNASGSSGSCTGNAATVTTNANLTGEVTSVGNAATITDDTVDEANLKADNAPVNDYVLTAKSSASGGLTWASPTTGDITGVTAGTNLNGGGTSGAVTLNLDTTITGLTSVTSTDFVGDVTGDLTGDVTGDVSGSSGSCTGNAATVTTNANLTGDVTSVGNATTYNNVIPVAKGGTTLTGFTAGDILYADTTTTLAKLAKGSDTEVLTLASGVPSWAAPTTGDITGVTAGTNLNGGGTSGTVTLNLDNPVVADVTGDVTGDLTGNADTVTTNANLTGDVTSVGNATTLGTVAVAKGGTNLTSYAAGDVLYATGSTALAKLAKPGTPAGEVLTFATSASAPSWVAPTTGDITGVTAGTNLNGGGTSGDVTLNLDNPVVADLTGDVTGDLTGNADTVTTNANLTGDVTSSGNATSIASGVIVDADVKSDAAIAYSKLGTIPTWNQDTTGNATTATTAAAGDSATDFFSGGTIAAARIATLNQDTTGNAATATLATTVTVTDSTADTAFPVVLHNESNALLDDTGAFTYNPTSSTVTATTFVGALTGNASGTAATVTGATQAAITSAANLVTVGTIGTGVWQGTTVAANQGGTGKSAYVVGDIIYASATDALSTLASSGQGGKVLAMNTGATAPEWTALPVEIGVACSDETTVFTASTSVAKTTLRMPHAMTLTSVRASLTTAASGDDGLTIDVHDSGTTIFSTKITIDDGDTTSVGATTPAVISDSALADNAEIEVFIDALDSSNAATGLKIWLIGTRA